MIFSLASYHGTKVLEPRPAVLQQVSPARTIPKPSTSPKAREVEMTMRF
eukprot:COSAG05_NODE_15742_length_362_cov_1.178707_1_plen_48_part_10